VTVPQGPRETPGITWEAWLLAALADIGRPALRSEVHGWVFERFGDSFTPADVAPRLRRGEPREPAWQNNLDSRYDRLKKRGLMLQIRHGAPWTLAPEAAERADLCLAAALASPAAASSPPVRTPVLEAGGPPETDLLRDFKPGSGFAYRSHLADRVLVKTRDHEPLLSAFGKRAAEQGWRATTRVHPRDLVLYRGDETWLVEVKVVREGNAVAATREAVAQLLEYSHFLHPEEPPRLLALFSENVGNALLGHLLKLGIEVVWRQGDGAWTGSTGAVSAGLAESA
jgi:hypothetical protein